MEKKNHKLYPVIKIVTISKELSEQLLKELIKLKFRTTRYSQLLNKTAKRQRAYMVVIRGEEMFHKFMKEISPNNPKHQAKYKRFMLSKGL